LKAHSPLTPKGWWLCLSFALVCVAMRSAGQEGNPVKPSTEVPLIRSLKGADLFRAYCASCHGRDGKGDGPAAVALKVKPADLTVLTLNNKGQFPTERVRKTITGELVVAAHGSREMPIWGPIFHQVEEDVDRGHVRVQNLVEYVQSIQAPPGVRTPTH
jgi:mono/diheme cytochrome c family protein